jgi:hypothetical protein
MSVQSKADFPINMTCRLSDQDQGGEGSWWSHTSRYISCYMACVISHIPVVQHDVKHIEDNLLHKMLCLLHCL